MDFHRLMGMAHGHVASTKNRKLLWLFQWEKWNRRQINRSILRFVPFVFFYCLSSIVLCELLAFSELRLLFLRFSVYDVRRMRRRSLCQCREWKKLARALVARCNCVNSRQPTQLCRRGYCTLNGSIDFHFSNRRKQIKYVWGTLTVHLKVQNPMKFDRQAKNCE